MKLSRSFSDTNVINTLKTKTTLKPKTAPKSIKCSSHKIRKIHKITKPNKQFNQTRKALKTRKKEFRKAQEAKFIVEMPVRKTQLADTIEKIKEMERIAQMAEANMVEKLDWDWLMKGGSIPNARDLKSVRTYISQWKSMDCKKLTIEEAKSRIDFVFECIKELHYETAKSIPDPNKKDHIADLLRIEMDLKILLQRNLNYGTFEIIKNIEENMILDYENLIAYQEVKTPNFEIGLHTKIPTPVPLQFSPKESFYKDNPVTLTFKDLNSKFEIPEKLTCPEVVMRVLLLKYDHISQCCKTWADPPCPMKYRQNMLEYVEEQWDRHLAYKEESNKAQELIQITSKSDGSVDSEPLIQCHRRPVTHPFPKKLKKRKTGRKKEESSSSSLSLSDEALVLMDTSNQDLESFFFPDVKDVLNLRKYLIVGRLIHINLFAVPRQPRVLMIDMKETAFLLPKKLKELQIGKYSSEFKRTQRVQRISIGVRRDSVLSQKSHDIEEIPNLITATEAGTIDSVKYYTGEPVAVKALEIKNILTEKSITVTVDVPQEVYWRNKPIICYWNEENLSWQTDGIYNVDFDETESQVSFGISRFGIYSFAVSKFKWFPFVHWKTISLPSTLTLDLITDELTFKFEISTNQICIRDVPNLDQVLREYWTFIGIEMNLNELVEKMRSYGVNLFPTFDLSYYKPTLTEKHWILERHVYYCISLLAFGYDFTPSELNLSADYTTIYVNTREHGLVNSKVVRIDTWGTKFVKANKPHTQNSDNYADLYQICVHTAKPETKKVILNSPKEKCYALFQLLCALRPFSFTHIQTSLGSSDMGRVQKVKRSPSTTSKRSLRVKPRGISSHLYSRTGEGVRRYSLYSTTPDKND